MKKTLVAIAALAAFGAQAQSSVTISGTFDAAAQNVKTTYGGGASVTQRNLNHSQDGTTGVIFSGTEDMGGGMKANFLYELNFNPADSGSLSSTPDNKTQFQNGQIFAGLSGGFGAIKVGSPNTPTLTTQTSRQFFGTKVGGGMNSSLGTAHVRNDSTVMYETPAMGGLTAAFAYSTKTKGDSNPTTAIAEIAKITDLGVNYANGPLKAGVSMYQLSANEGNGGATAAGKNSQTNAYVQYAIGALTLAGGTHTESTETSATNTTKTLDASGTNVAAKYQMTPTVALLANYAKLNDKLTANKDSKTTAIGAQIALSKRSTVYVRYVDYKLDNHTTATSAAATKTTLLGLKHTF